MSIYRGSKILSGTVVFGNIIKLSNGNTDIFFGNSFIFISTFIQQFKKYSLILVIFFSPLDGK
jgi:hypothetical protein